MRLARLALFALSTLLAGGSLPAHATVPSTMSYQGVLTDNAGNLVADGLYNFVFKVYDVGGGGAALWTETQNNIQVTRGGLTAILGSITPLSLPFDRQYYLGISVNGGAELVPRVILASSPQAMSLRLPFAGSESSSGPVLSVENTGSGHAIVASPRILVGSSTANGSVGVTGPGASGETASISETGSGGELRLRKPGGGFLAAMFPDNWGDGAWYVTEENGFYGSRLGADGTGNSDPYFFMLGPSNTLSIDLSISGDNGTQLPTSAVGAGEVADEPGIAQGHFTGSISIPTGIFVVDMVSVTITTPAGGYIVVEADGMHGIGGNGATMNEGNFTIKNTTGGGLDVNHYFVSGFNTAAPNGLTRLATSLRRTYFESSAGTYTYYFQAVASNPGGFPNYLWDPTITATYFPTSYGTVTTVVSGTDAARDGLTTKSVPGSVGPGGERGEAGSVLVDLRELELRAANTRAEAERAHRLLIEARMRVTPSTLPDAAKSAAKP